MLKSWVQITDVCQWVEKIMCMYYVLSTVKENMVWKAVWPRNKNFKTKRKRTSYMK